MARTSPWTSRLTDFTHWVKQTANLSGFSMANTRPKVSSEGIPLGNFRNRSNQPRLAFLKSLISTQLSAPQITVTG